MRHLLWLLALAPLWAQAEVPLADFVRDGDVDNVKISPDGKYLGEVLSFEDHDDLVFLDLATHKVNVGIKADRDRRIADYWWVGPGRVVFSFGQQYGGLSRPFYTGELFGLDADPNSGAPVKYLFGYRDQEQKLGTRIGGGHAADYRSAEVISDPLPGGHEAMIQINDFGGEIHPDPGEVDRLDVYTGARHRVSEGPVRSYDEFLLDANGNPRYAYGRAEDDTWVSYVKVDAANGQDAADVADSWKPLADGVAKNAHIRPQELTADGHRVFMISDENSNQYCLVEQNLESGARRKMSCDAAASVTGLVMSFDRKEVIAARYDGAPPWIRMLDTDNPDAARIKSLQKAFPGQMVVPVSQTEDGSKVVLLVYSDRNPGDYYLFEPKTMKADLADSRRNWIDPDQMSEQRPIQFKARDGQLIHGLLTLPVGAGEKNLPLVVNPHGGPFGERDTWGWDVEPQLLASRGYAVLQVNFRGSGGYGEAFVDAGKQHWDSLMIDDITDGVHWLIGQGTVDAGRICIYGASYGGYAALMSAVREPDLYRCTVGYAGVYDLNRQKSDSDTSDTSRGRNFMDEFIGTDEAKLKAASPITYIDRLKAAVMIVHGEDDQRVKFSQAKLLRSALDDRKYPYEWLVKSGEGHGFYEEKNRLELYQKLLAFLDRNIGPQTVKGGSRAAVAATPAVTPDAAPVAAPAAVPAPTPALATAPPAN